MTLVTHVRKGLQEKGKRVSKKGKGEELSKLLQYRVKHLVYFYSQAFHAFYLWRIGKVKFFGDEELGLNFEV